MTAHSAPSSMFKHIMALNKEAFQRGDYNTAYHLLAAALRDERPRMAGAAA